MDSIAMSPSGALPVIRTIAETGATLASGTRTHLGEITTNAPAIGAGTLGSAFRTAHQPASDATLGAAEQLPPVFQHLGEAGETAVRAYLEADAQAAGGYGR
jgi:hypothetical protein